MKLILTLLITLTASTSYGFGLGGTYYLLMMLDDGDTKTLESDDKNSATGKKPPVQNNRFLEVFTGCIKEGEGENPKLIAVSSISSIEPAIFKVPKESNKKNIIDYQARTPSSRRKARRNSKEFIKKYYTKVRTFKGKQFLLCTSYKSLKNKK